MPTAKTIQSQKPRVLKPRRCSAVGGLDKFSLFTRTFYIANTTLTDLRMLFILTHTCFEMPAALAFLVCSRGHCNLQLLCRCWLKLGLRDYEGKAQFLAQAGQSLMSCGVRL